MFHLIAGGRTPLLTYAEDEASGCKYVALAITALPAVAKGVYDAMRRVREDGTSNAHLDPLFTFQEFGQAVRLDRSRQMADRYLPSEMLEERYGGGRSVV